MTTDSVRVSLGGPHPSQIAAGVIGVLVITGEYGTGMIRASLAAVPQRRPLLAAKTAVLAVTALIGGIASCFAAWFAFQAFLPAGDPLRTSLSDPGVLRAVTGAGTAQGNYTLGPLTPHSKRAAPIVFVPQTNAGGPPPGKGWASGRACTVSVRWLRRVPLPLSGRRPAAR